MCSKKLDAQRTAAVFWLVFGLILSAESYRIGLGRLYSPGSGFFPFLAGLIIIGLASTLTLQSLLRPSKNKKTGPALKATVNYRNIVLCLVFLYAYVLVFERLGFIPSTFLLIILLLKFVERRGWVITLVFAFLVAVMLYILFDVLLHTTLPKGILGP